MKVLTIAEVVGSVMLPIKKNEKKKWHLLLIYLNSTHKNRVWVCGLDPFEFRVGLCVHFIGSQSILAGSESGSM